MPARKPNILWIVTTQWRAQACGYAGDANARTPAIDALAAQSVNYAQAVTPHPFGPFARAALLTGVPSPQNGVRDYHDPLPPGARTIAHEMNDRGYATAFFGKWHLAPRDPTAALVGEPHAKMIVPPEMRGGFGFWEGFEGGFLLNDPWLHGTRLPAPVQFRGYQSDVLGERAAEWIREHSTANVQRPTPKVGKPDTENEPRRPFFAIVSLEAPHPPYDAPAGSTGSPQAAGVEKGAVELTANVPAEARERASRELAGYHAHIEATDRAIGRLVSALASDTIVAFTSVHGDMHGAHGLFRKGWPHEESVRVPLLVRHPAESARRDEAPVSLLDLPAMTLAWAEGRDWRCLRQAAPISMPSVVRLPHQCDRVWHGWRTPARKLVLDAANMPWLFFDLERDPLELCNLATEPLWAVEMAALSQSR
jgi:arylsulfatase A-like enzyme